MNSIRQTGCYLAAILLLACLIQGELLWIENVQAERSLTGYSEKSEFERYEDAVESVWTELVWYPVPESDSNPRAVTSFENSWHAERNYGGARQHEGTDLMASVDQSGYYPVVSMTDGTIEKVGWLEKGGWRIGIRSENDNYYYYAHLHSYAEEWEAGTEIQAGDLLGYMGDTGYGPEGTTGQFPVHLHVGIYLPLDADQELAINPYWMLKYLENKKLTYSY
jgi:murein DD-endopeptidase MepM/ murein hydrolase activator NlpD